MIQYDRNGIDTADETARQNVLPASARTATDPTIVLPTVTRTIGDPVIGKIENDLDASCRDDHLPVVIGHSTNLPSEKNRIRRKLLMAGKRKSLHAPSM